MMRRSTRIRLLVAAMVVTAAACSPSSTPTPTSAPSASDSPAAAAGRVILLGQIVTMDEPAVAEAIAFEDGVVLAVGTRDEVMALADDETQVIDMGTNVAYPGFTDAHAHWIGDRGFMGLNATEEAVDAAVSRGWTSIAELWVDEGRIQELSEMAAADQLRLRVDGYLALNAPAPTGEHFGDWYTAYEPGSITDRLRVQGVKITLDNGWGSLFWWQPAELLETVDRADAAGWQVAIHTVSTEAHEMVLAAYEHTLAGGPNARHHRIDHAIQVTDEQLARLVALDLATIIHLDATDWASEADFVRNLSDNSAWLMRWRNFVEAGLHVAAASDAPWTFPYLPNPTGLQTQVLTDDIGRPVDQIAGGMDGLGRASETPDWLLAQLLTAEQGLEAITIGAAYALNDEANRGHLAPGTYADITILSGDVTTLTPAEIRNLQVIATIVGGVTEYCSDPSFCP